MFNKFNGWQRLWVVYSILLLVTFAFYVYYSISHDFMRDAFPVGKIVAEGKVYSKPGGGTFLSRQDIGAIFPGKIIRESKDKCVAEFNVRWSRSHPFLSSQKERPDIPPGYRLEPNLFDLVGDREYNSCKKKEQVKLVFKTILIWLIAITFVYGVGFSVPWVRRGFRLKKE